MEPIQFNVQSSIFHDIVKVLYSTGSLFARYTFLQGIKEPHREREGERRHGGWQDCNHSRGTCLPSLPETTYKRDQGWWRMRDCEMQGRRELGSRGLS